MSVFPSAGAGAPAAPGARISGSERPGTARIYAISADNGTATPDAGGSSAGPGAAPSATGCKVNSFKMKVGKWDISWPGLFSGTSSIRLPVSFEAELAKGSSRSDCIIYQMKRGEVESDGTVDRFPTWTADGQIGNFNWWDGEKWTVPGSWVWLKWAPEERAEFSDMPGFNSSTAPLYYGGVRDKGSKARKGHFEFQTVISDKRTLAPVSTLTWGLLIDYPVPEKGSHYFYL